MHERLADELYAAARGEGKDIPREGLDDYSNFLKLGSAGDFGRHYGEANKIMKRLANLIMALDMNVVVTAHSKKEYGDNLKVLGHTFDAGEAFPQVVSHADGFYW